MELISFHSKMMSSSSSSDILPLSSLQPTNNENSAWMPLTFFSAAEFAENFCPALS